MIKKNKTTEWNNVALHFSRCIVYQKSNIKRDKYNMHTNYKLQNRLLKYNIFFSGVIEREAYMVLFKVK